VSALPDRLPDLPERAAAPGARREAVAGRTVYKFGGTSVADAARIREVARLVGEAPTRPVLVVSALGGVTDRLVAIAESIRDGNDLWGDILPKLEARHMEALAELTEGDPAARAAL
jgi:bifunctional aspartokinase / homoserine dehydrogenase 1